MKTIIEIAKRVYGDHVEFNDAQTQRLQEIEALVRADERERAQRENAYVALEREACAKVCDSWSLRDSLAAEMAKEIRARGNT